MNRRIEIRLLPEEGAESTPEQPAPDLEPASEAAPALAPSPGNEAAPPSVPEPSLDPAPTPEGA